MRARVTNLEVEGFRAIRSPLRLSLREPDDGPPLSRFILAGPNGSGKTSVLEAILLAFGHSELIVRDLPAAQRGDHWRVELPPGARIKLRYQPLKLIAPAVTIVRTADRWELRDDDDRLVTDDPATVRARVAEVSIEYFSSWRAPILPGGLQPTSAGRPPVDNEANRLRRLKQRIINERSRRAFTLAPDLFPQDAVWLTRLNEVWRALHHDRSTIEAAVVDPRADDPLFDLFVYDGDTRRCSIDQISSGELELVTMAGTLLLAGFDGILLVDEPELHLHREWQTPLLDALRAMAPSAQLIIATHADAPWDQAFSFERFFLASPADPRASAGEP